MKTLIMMLAFLNIAFNFNVAQANEYYCEWFDGDAKTTAKNRDSEIREIERIDQYLVQEQRYAEGKIILPLIDRTCNIEREIDIERLAFM